MNSFLRPNSSQYDEWMKCCPKECFPACRSSYSGESACPQLKQGSESVFTHWHELQTHVLGRGQVWLCVSKTWAHCDIQRTPAPESVIILLWTQVALNSGVAPNLLYIQGDLDSLRDDVMAPRALLCCSNWASPKQVISPRAHGLTLSAGSLGSKAL